MTSPQASSSIRATKLTLSFNSARVDLPEQEPAAPAKSTEPVQILPQTEKSAEKKAAKPDKPASKPKKQKTNPRALTEYHRPRILGTLAQALGLETIEQLPPYFLVEEIVPAKIGLKKDLIERFNDRTIDKALLDQGMKQFRWSLGYCNAVLEDTQRYDLDLNPVEGTDGQITDDHRNHARMQRDTILKSIRNKKKTK
ncbi:hypothetical protein TRICHSKD4_6160 [Roseibium sp. TrichSKD4]|uniref:ProQ/FINO family protein n=1 Tax=Roseibium sp. TrichSKD4 TaxID=744980 RepID=UPI0001E5721E|nr:ProQ/FINO family protein [Roseibium sp. TrichSKD4]EFO28780.1 hypothetical protein TRICHSKD4_6160 [Roseibium sp. TrichSKD4]